MLGVAVWHLWKMVFIHLTFVSAVVDLAGSVGICSVDMPATKGKICTFAITVTDPAQASS